MANISSGTAKKMIIGSWVVAGIVALLSLVDIVWSFPYHGQMVMDIMFILGAGLVGYLGYDAFNDLR